MNFLATAFEGHDKACHTCAHMRWSKPYYIEDGRVRGHRTQARSMECARYRKNWETQGRCESARAEGGPCANGEGWVAK